MNDAATQSPTALRVERTFQAPAQAVFDAWTNPEVLRRWFAGGADWDTPLAEVDLRVGGSYRLTMRSADGEEHTVGGEYTEITPPDRLAFTWTWGTEGMASGEGSLVEIEFNEDAGSTTVVLVHSGFETDEAKQQHSHGWDACLDNLGRRVFETA